MNQDIFYFLHSLTGHSNLLDALFIFMAQYLGYLMFFLLVLMFLYSYRLSTLFEVAHILVVSVIAWLPSHFIKVYVLWVRPFAALELTTLLTHFYVEQSFPSGHATFFSALATAVYIYDKKWSMAFAVGAFLIGVSRVITGLHWPIDVVAGWAIGAGGVFIVSWLIRPLERLRNADPQQ